MSKKDSDKQKKTAEALWAAHAEAPSEDTVGHLVSFYLPMVRQTVAMMSIYCGAGLDRDDLIQYAMMGLWHCIETFDPERRVQFRSYATVRIRGAVLDALRRHDPLSRKERALLKSLQGAVAAYSRQHEAIPDAATLAAEVNVDLSRLRELAARAQPFLSLDGAAHEAETGEGLTLGQRLIDERAPNPRMETMRHEQGRIFRKAFRHLPQRQQKILYLYYYEDLTLKEIGATLDLTEARICQLHATALLFLRALMQKTET